MSKPPKIFNGKKNKDSKFNARFDYYAWMGQRYCDGYYTAAYNLVINLHDKDMMVYPIIFLFRHYIELSLKRNICLAQIVINSEFNMPDKDHSLEALWREFALLCNGWIQMIDFHDEVKATVLELHNIDPKSTNVRYPSHKENDKSLPVHIKTIDLYYLLTRMTNVKYLFDHVSGICSDMLRTREDFKSLRLLGDDPRLFDVDYEQTELNPEIPL